MLDLSAKKIDGFIMLSHCVHVLGDYTVCQNFTLHDTLKKKTLLQLMDHSEKIQLLVHVLNGGKCLLR